MDTSGFLRTFGAAGVDSPGFIGMNSQGLKLALKCMCYCQLSPFVISVGSLSSSVYAEHIVVNYCFWKLRTLAGPVLVPSLLSASFMPHAGICYIHHICSRTSNVPHSPSGFLCDCSRGC